MDKKYAQLLDTYRDMFNMVDAFHFNSKNTADVFSKYVDVPMSSMTIPITHSGIKDKRKIRFYDNQLLRLGFIGSEAPYKGLPLLKEIISLLNKDGYRDKVVLHVYGGRIGQDDVCSNILYKGRFMSSMMEQVYDDMDLLVVPSIWNETFSLVTLEALSYGTSVLVSDKVGAKDIVSNYAPQFVFKTKEDLFNTIQRLIENRQDLISYNESVVKSPWLSSLENHSKDIIAKLYK